LLIVGEKDHLEPLALNEANLRHYKHSKATTELKAFPGRAHYTIGQDGWEEVADYALTWATKHARSTESLPRSAAMS
jgi:hypothetical protein